MRMAKTIRYQLGAPSGGLIIQGKGHNMAAHAFLAGLKLADVRLTAVEPEVKFSRSRGELTEPVDPSPPVSMAEELARVRAAVNVGSVVSFVEGLEAQQKDDVLDSLQLAQRAASHDFDRYTQVREWYQRYLDVLAQVGWQTEQFAFVEHGQHEGDLRMDKAALGVIAAIATQNQLAVLQEAITALGALAEGDGTLSLFEQQSALNGVGNLQIGAAQRAPNGVVGMAMGAFHFQSVDVGRRILFFRSASKAVRFWSAAQRMTLNTATYAENRVQIRQMLGEQRRLAIAAIQLA